MEAFQADYFILFVIISLGIMLGRIKIKGFSLDLSAVIFVALLFGHFGFVVPSVFQKMGLLLFIYSVGIQSGPGFFGSFDKKTGQWMVVTAVLVVVGTLLAAASIFLFDVDTATATGLLAGALTSTPGLAAAIETTQSHATSIGYGIAYPFGVIGVMLFIHTAVKLFRINPRQEAENYQAAEQADYPPILHKHYRVENPNVVGKRLNEINIRGMTDASVSRIQQPGQPRGEAPTSRTLLQEGALIRAVGTEKALEKMRLLIGPETGQRVKLEEKSDVQWILVTNKKVVGKPLEHFHLFHNFNATITRVKRSGVELTPSPRLAVKFGDKLLIASKGNMKSVARLFGNNDKKLSETDFLPISLGIVLGVIIGQIPLAGGFSLGLTGGVLTTALLMSWIGKTGPVIWQVSGSANQLIRQLGLLFFLAAVGTEAGAVLMATIAEHGFRLLGIGLVITLVPMVAAVSVGMWAFHINFLTLMGVLTGGMTSTPGLTVAQSLADTDAPNIAYATVYPLAMVLLILCIQGLSLL